MTENQRLINKIVLEEINGVSNEKSMEKLLDNLFPSQEEIKQEQEKQYKIITDAIGKISPFFGRAVEQLRDLILETYNTCKKDFFRLNQTGKITRESFEKVYLEIELLDAACGKLIEVLNTQAKKYDNTDIINERLDPVYTMVDGCLDIKNLDDNIRVLEKAFHDLDLLFCPKTFQEIMDPDRNDHYFAYANYFFVEYTLIAEPAVFIRELL